MEHCEQFKNERSCNQNIGCAFWKFCMNRKPFYHQSDQDFLFEKIFDKLQLKVEYVTSEYDDAKVL